MRWLPEPVKRPLRPLKELAVRMATRGRVVRQVNGRSFVVATQTRQLFRPDYDPGATLAMTKALHPGATAWNVGANVGIHVLQMADRVGPTGRVFAFEPNPHALELLRRNVELNGFGDRVTIIPAAVGESAGETDFHVAGFDGMARGGMPNPLLRVTQRIRVPVVTMDDFLARHGKPDCVLMDIEGWEVGALLGGQSLLQPKMPALIVELHSPAAWKWSGHSEEALRALLERHRLRVTPLSGQADPLRDHGQVLIEQAKPHPPAVSL